MTRYPGRLTLVFAFLAAAVASAAPRQTVLGVFAHPDDEVLMAGTLHQFVRAGHQVRAVYVTSGDAGQDRSGRGLNGTALAAVRQRETRTSNRILGTAEPPVFLEFEDGQVYRDLERVAAALDEVLRETSPALVMTLGPNGVTGHPDHMAVHLAVRNLRDRIATPPEWLAVVFSERRAGLFEKKWGMRGVQPHAIDVRVRITPEQARRRLLVLKAHKTQFRPEMIETYRSHGLAEDLVEHFQGATTLTGVTLDG